MFLSAISPRFFLVLDPRSILEDLGGKVESACEEFEDNELRRCLTQVVLFKGLVNTVLVALTQCTRIKATQSTNVQTYSMKLK